MTRPTELDPDDTDVYRLARRAVLRATGGVAALSLAAGTAAASNHGDGDTGSDRGPDGSTPGDIDPIFGRPSAGPLPEGLADHVVDMEIGIPGLLFGVTAAGGLSEETTAAVNEAVADGSLTGDDLTEDGPEVGGERVSVPVIAEALTNTLGFHFHPAGLAVEPGDVVAFTAPSPDHAVASFHERHGRQNRVPGAPGSGTGLISAPLVPVGGHWLYRFTRPGVYDLYCPPHELFGMVMRVVVVAGRDVPELSVDGEGRPPEDVNEMKFVLGGLDPNLPSAAEAFATDALDPENVVDEGTVDWEAVVEEHRTG